MTHFDLALLSGLDAMGEQVKETYRIWALFTRERKAGKNYPFILDQRVGYHRFVQYKKQ